VGVVQPRSRASAAVADPRAAHRRVQAGKAARHNTSPNTSPPVAGVPAVVREVWSEFYTDEETPVRGGRRCGVT
jgi:hypothetical protein